MKTGKIITVASILGVLGFLFINRNNIFLDAALRGYDNIAKFTLKVGADVNDCGFMENKTPLLMAVEQGNTKAVERLLNWGARAEKTYCHEKKQQESLLDVAARNLDIPMLSFLQEKGFKIEDSNALLSALDNETLSKDDSKLKDTVEYLISQKVDVKKDKNKALLLAVRGKHTQIAEMLIKSGADVNVNEDVKFKRNDISYTIHSGEPDTLLTIAIEQKDIPTAEMLLRKGAHIRLPNKHLLVPYIVHAANKNDSEMVRLLVKYGANVNEKGNERGGGSRMTYGTALIEAVANQNNDLAKWLLDKGAKVNTKGIYAEKTALMLAAKNGDEDMVKMLLQKGANAKLTDSYGNNARNYAEEELKTKSEADKVVESFNISSFSGGTTKEEKYSHIIELLAKYDGTKEYEDYKRIMWICRAAYEVLQNPYDYQKEIFLETQKSFQQHNCAAVLSNHARTVAEINARVRLEILRENGWL